MFQAWPHPTLAPRADGPGRNIMNRFVVPALLTALIAIPTMSNDAVFAAIPAIRSDFGESPASVQIALSSFIYAFAITQLIYGPLSDRFGRRPVLIATMVLYTGASVLCAVAADLNALVWARVLQGIGAASGPAVARAVLRDLYGAEKSAQILSYVMAAFGVIAISAPVIGGGLTEYFGWPAVFYWAALYEVILLIGIVALLPETNTSPNKSATDPIRLLRNMSMLMADGRFRSFTTVNTAIYCAMFAWLSGGMFVLIEGAGLGADLAGTYFAISIVGFIVGSMIAGRMLARIDVEKVVAIGLLLCASGCVAGAVVATAWPPTAFAMIAPATLLMAGVGLVIPPATSAGIAPFPHIAGTASSLIGFCQWVGGGTTVLAVGYLYDGTALPLYLFSIAICLVAGAVMFRNRTSKRRTQSL